MQKTQTNSRHFLVVTVVAALLLFSAADGLHAQIGTGGWEGSIRTPWGDPDISGTFHRLPVGIPTICGAAREVILLPPVYAGVTQIVQTRKHVMFRSQFARYSRAVPLNGRDAERMATQGYLGDSLARWEESTLVVASRNLPANTVAALTQREDALSQDVEVVERFTPTANGALDYEFVVHDSSGYSGGVTIVRFTLVRASSAQPPKGDGGSCLPSTLP
jgi:hypothetical protein